MSSCTFSTSLYIVYIKVSQEKRGFIFQRSYLHNFVSKTFDFFPIQFPLSQLYVESIFTGLYHLQILSKQLQTLYNAKNRSHKYLRQTLQKQYLINLFVWYLPIRRMVVTLFVLVLSSSYCKENQSPTSSSSCIGFLWNISIHCKENQSPTSSSSCIGFLWNKSIWWWYSLVSPVSSLDVKNLCFSSRIQALYLTYPRI